MNERSNTFAIQQLIRSASLAITFFLLLSGCRRSGSSPNDNATSGEITISVDESYQLLFDTQVYTFESFYKYAKIHAFYKPESEAVKDMLEDSARFTVMSRELNEAELQEFKKVKITPRVVKIAYDAVAFIVNNNNSDSLLTVEQLKKMISGEFKEWKDINSRSALGSALVVFDNNGSGNARFMKEKLLEGKSFSDNCFAVNSNPEVIEYVSTHKNALGVIGVNWISDKDDTLTRGFLKKVKVVSVATDSTDKYYKPYQAYIQLKKYPFTRDVYIVSREARAGLGTGFAAFVAGDKGQRMILKSGLVPATAPVRLVNVKK